ncbi:MAG: flavin reductase family protein [Thermodesulfobacteriota bacterium]
MKIDPKELNWHKSHDLLTDLVAPRPIAWVATIGADGIYNLAPYSYFTPMCNQPMILGFSVARKANGQKKDTLVNIEECKEFVVGVVTEALAGPMIKSAAAYPIHVDEFKEASLTPVPADIVAAPLVSESPVNMECRLLQILHLYDGPRKNDFIIGEVVRIHIRDDVIVENQIDASKLKLIARLGGRGKAYCRTTDIFNISREE